MNEQRRNGTKRNSDDGAPRLLVLGGGPAGYAGAFHAADLGLRVTLVDEEPNPGGVCLYRGCIPSKALLHVAKTMDDARELESCGVRFGTPEIDLDAIREWKDEVVRELTRGLGQLRDHRRIEFIQGRGVLEDSRTLRVTTREGETRRIGFDYALLAPGARPRIPSALALDSERVMDSDAALAVPDVPETLLQIGGGYIGLEMAMVYAALGSRVSVVEMTGGLLPGADRDLIEPMERRLRERLEAIHLHTQVVGMEEVEGGIRVELSGLRVEEPVRTYAKVLVCVGRRPATDGLGLETTKARVDARGFVRTDAQRRSDDPALFVVGDAAGEPMLAHKASYEARRAVEVIAGRPEAADAQAVPAVMFTDPEVAWAGLTETKAKAEHIPVRVLRFPWGASGRAKTLNRREGLTKILVDPPTHRILGVGVVGPGAGELLAEGAFAIETGARVEDLSLTVHAHPTLSETLMEAAESFFGSSTHFAGRM